MNIIETNINEIIMCMAYCMNAIISPTSSVSSPAAFAPNHTMATFTKLIMSVTAGISDEMVLCTNLVVKVRSLFAVSNVSETRMLSQHSASAATFFK